MRPLVVAAALLALTPAFAQDPAPSAATYRIAGTVVSESTGQPLQRATLQLLNPEDSKPTETTTSDGLGRFAFSGIGAGNHILQGSAPGYLATNYDDHDGFNTGIITGTGADTESLVLKLRPQGTIAGTILDETGDPVERGTVRLFRQSHSFGDSRIVAAGTVSTDDLGRFEFARLAPGAYLLAVNATPWYAVHTDPRTGPQQRPVSYGDSIAPSIDPALDVAYPTTFYPGTTDSSQAAPILVRGGPVDLSLRLTPLPALTVSFAFAPSKDQPVPFPQLRTSIFGQLQPVFGQSYQQSQGQVTLVGIPPGDYILSDARTNQPQGTPLHLTDRNLEADLPTRSEQAHVHVLLHQIDGSPVPNGILIGLDHAGIDPAAPADTPNAARTNSSKGEATLDVAPGDYSFSVCGGGRRCFVRQVAAGDRTLSANRIHIDSIADQTFTVTFVIGTHTVKGIAQKDGKPAPGTFLLLFPAEEAHAIHNYERQQSDLDGTFDFTGLAPGDYLAVAIDNGWDIDWRRDVVLSKYLPAAVPIHVTDSPGKVQSIPTPVPVQPR